jgi:signal transduction histidine kinase
MFWWSLINYIEPIIYIVTAYLFYTYTYKNDVRLRTKVIIFLLFLPILLLGPTSLNLAAYDYTNCYRLAIEGVLLKYIYIFEALIIAMIFVSWLRFLRQQRLPSEKRQVTLLAIGALLFLLALSSGNIFGTLFQDSLGEEAWMIAQYGLFGMPILLGFIVYLIVQFNAFRIRLISAQALVATVAVLVASLMFVAATSTTRVIALITLCLVVILGYFLIKSVNNTLKQKQEIEKLAGDLQQANSRLRELDKMKSEFVSIASHQLRSPLTSIRGYTSMVLEGTYGKLPPKAVPILENISESARFMALSIEDYLNVSRIEAGNMKYELSDFNLKQLSEKLVDELRPTALKRGLVLLFRSDLDGAATVHADIGKTRQVLSNLIDNAIKYTPRGSITVIVHDSADKKSIQVSVVDTGVGMSEDTRGSIFQKFVRAQNANSINVTGTGLGLYIAHKMIVDMGGTLTAHSDGEGTGSTFRVSFPRV